MLQVPLEIAFHNVEPSDWAEQEIRARVADLERLYGRLNSCRVRIDQRAKDLTGAIPPVVHIELGIPGRPDLVVSHEPDHLMRKYQRPELRNAINEAFRIAERQLLDLKDHRDARNKGVMHESEQQFLGQVAEINPDDDFGFLSDQGGQPPVLPPQFHPRRQLRQARARRRGALCRGDRRYRPDGEQGPREGEESCTNSHDEQAGKPQQHLAVVARRIGAWRSLRCIRRRTPARSLVERDEKRPQRRALEPFDDRARVPAMHVVVDRVPDVEAAAQRPEQIVIAAGAGRSSRAAAAGAEVGRPKVPLPATSRMSESAGSSVLSGICTASTPPCGSASSSRRSTAGWSGTH